MAHANRPSSRATDLTALQQRFLVVLLEEANRTLSLRALCAKVGASPTQWYRALRDATFRAQVEALGVRIQRGTPPIRGAPPLAQDPNAEWGQDRIDVRRLVADYPRHESGALWLDFTCIANPVLRTVVKRYFRTRLGVWEPLSLRTYLQRMRPFFLALSATYPTLESFAELTRPMIEPLLHGGQWTDAQGHVHRMSAHKRLHMLIPLDVMFTSMQRHAWDDAPRSLLIFDEDKPKLPKRRPRPVPESVLEQLQANVHRLRPYARNLLAILGVAGLRIGDALRLPEDCLEYDATADPRLHWYNHKLKRDGRPLPVTQEVVAAIQRQRELVREVPDLFGKHYLFRSHRGLYQARAFCRHLNHVAQQVPIRGPDGAIYHFKSHQFRHTVGTQMINNGMGIADVMAYLDHQSPEMTLQYTEIYDETLKQKFKEVVLAGQAVGGLALQALREQLASGDEGELDWIAANLRRLSLPWGHCLHHPKAPKCPYGQNACFTKDNGPCHKLVTTPQHAPIILQTKQDLERSLHAAEEQGWEMYANDLREQISGMEHVLSTLNQLPTTACGSEEEPSHGQDA